MGEREQNENKKHTLSLTARTRAEIEGVREVESFDEQSVILMTDCGELTLEGEGLHVGTLDMVRGIVAVDGRISAVYYGDGAPTRRGLRARLFG